MDKLQVDWVLDKLTRDVSILLSQITPRALEDYDFLQANIQKVNVAQHSKFQSTFANYYVFRGIPKAQWKEYFLLLEAEKANSGLTFEQALDQLRKLFKKIHASFASKLLATVNPDNPIYDSQVAACLGLTVWYEKLENRKRQQALWLFEEISEFHRQARAHGGLPPLIAAFDQRFPSYRHFSSVKKLDFLMWRSGARRQY